MIKNWIKRAMMWRPEVLKGAAKATKSENVKPANLKQAVNHEVYGDLSAFLRAHYVFRYNVLTEQTEMARVGADALEFVGVGQRELNTVCLEVHEAKLLCWDSDVRRFIESERVEAYHPFVEYFRTLPVWDGVDRVTPLAQRVSDKPVWVNGFRIWMRAAAAQYMGKAEMANCLMPIVVSAEQGWGKSTFCHNLLPQSLRRYYTETFNLTNSGSAEERLANYGEINLDEMDRLSDMKMAVLKNVMQVRTINLRKAYHHHMQSLPRIASFIGTSNRRDLLTDRTGSRRFICVELEHPIDNETPIEYDQLYAQLKAEVMAGERTWLTKEEEAEVHANNLPFYRITLEEDVFSQCFRFADRNEEGSEILTAAEIFEVMQQKNPTALRGLTAYAFSRLLPSMGPRVRTKHSNGYCVMRL
jgi:predicted P-loop ATPase